LPQPGWKWKAGECAKCGAPRAKGMRCKPCHNETLRAWYAKNPKRQLEAKHRYHANHPDRIAAQRVAYKTRPEIKAKEAEYSRKPKAVAKRKAREGTPKYALIRKRGWSQRAVRMAAAGEITATPWTEHDYWRLFHIEQEGRCALCGEKSARLLTVDHIVPIARGGTNDPENIQLLCFICNSRKGVRPMSGIAHKLVMAGAY
jgi:5-methylcytosine-specific restriction endonuclease McrA